MMAGLPGRLPGNAGGVPAKEGCRPGDARPSSFPLCSDIRHAQRHLADLATTDPRDSDSAGLGRGGCSDLFLPGSLLILMCRPLAPTLRT